MDMKLEKALTLCVVVAFIVPSINSLATLGNPVTREEAIEIGKNTAAVKYNLERCIANSLPYWVETDYRNSSEIEQIRQRFQLKNLTYSGVFKVPEGHSAWEVTWCFMRAHNLGEIWSYIFVIDAETAKIVYESSALYF